MGFFLLGSSPLTTNPIFSSHLFLIDASVITGLISSWSSLSNFLYILNWWFDWSIVLWMMSEKDVFGVTSIESLSFCKYFCRHKWSQKNVQITEPYLHKFWVQFYMPFPMVWSILFGILPVRLVFLGHFTVCSALGSYSKILNYTRITMMRNWMKLKTTTV